MQTDTYFTLQTTAPGVAHLQLSRPERLNTLAPAFFPALREAVQALNAAGQTRALVISSTGKHFCAGMALEVFASDLSGLDTGNARARLAFQDWLRQNSSDEEACNNISIFIAGGMLTKLQAADIARRSGTRVVIARGDLPDVLARLVNGEKLGTCFHAVTDTLESRKRFMLAGAVPRASIRIDEGALKALRGGGSLLPVGITGIQGRFDRGDIVKVKTAEGKVFLIRYLSLFDAWSIRLPVGENNARAGNRHNQNLP